MHFNHLNIPLRDLAKLQGNRTSQPVSVKAPALIIAMAVLTVSLQSSKVTLTIPHAF